MRKPRLNWLDAWIGICVCLVIFGHAMLPGVPQWYIDVHSWIYSFHMAAFFFASGALVQYHYPKKSSERNVYFGLIQKKLLRLGLPYLLLGSALTLAKGLFESYSFAQTWEMLGYLLYRPISSAAIFLWYIYVLLIFYILSPLICRGKLTRKIIVLSGAIIFYLIPINTDLFALHLIKKYLFFFCLGTITWPTRHILKKIPDSYFVFLSFLFLLNSLRIIDLPFIVNALLAIAALNLLSKHIINIKTLKKTNKLFALLSRNSLNIYLFQMPCIVTWYYFMKFLAGVISNTFWWIFFLSLLPVAIIGSLTIAVVIDFIVFFLKKHVSTLLAVNSKSKTFL